MSNTITQYMAVRPAEEFAGHGVGVDSAVGVFVVTADGLELNFELEVQEDLYEALGEHLGRVN